MAENYAAAAARHYRDGVLLHGESRIENADHLFGLAAECAVKSALVRFPQFAASGRLDPAYHKHVNLLLNSVPVHSVQRRYGALASILSSCRSHFSDWSIDQRYHPDGLVHVEAIDRHRKAAQRLLGSVGLTGVRSEK